MIQRFRDRADAGQRLASALASYANDRPIVLALPRGGVTVGYEVARALHAPLDVWVVRKVGAPWQEELGVGAVAESSYLYLSDRMLAETGLSEAALAGVIAAKRREVDERVRTFRGDRPRPALRDRTVIVVDDGIATGGTVRAAVRSIRDEGPRRVVVAVPVAAPEEIARLREEVDDVVVLLAVADLMAIGYWYDDFTQVTDREVVELLDRARPERADPAHAMA